jgi:hypothetical protein
MARQDRTGHTLRFANKKREIKEKENVKLFSMVLKCCEDNFPPKENDIESGNFSGCFHKVYYLMNRANIASTRKKTISEACILSRIKPFIH